MHRVLAFLALALSLSCSAQELIDQLYANTPDGQLGIEVRYRRVKGAKAGRYLAENYPGKRVLVLVPPEMPMVGGGKAAEPPYKATVEGFQMGLGGKLSIVAMVEPKMPAAVRAKLQNMPVAVGPNGQGMVMMPEGLMWFDVTALNNELAPFKAKFDILVCFTMLPGTGRMIGGGDGKQDAGFEKLDFWLDEKVNVLLLEGGVNLFGKLIQVGKIIGAATYRQNISEDAYEKPPPQNLEDAFKMRFVLITPKNLAQHMSYFAWPRP
jgi:hypothetical protein